MRHPNCASPHAAVAGQKDSRCVLRVDHQRVTASRAMRPCDRRRSDRHSRTGRHARHPGVSKLPTASARRADDGDVADIAGQAAQRRDAGAGPPRSPACHAPHTAGERADDEGSRAVNSQRADQVWFGAGRGRPQQLSWRRRAWSTGTKGGQALINTGRTRLRRRVEPAGDFRARRVRGASRRRLARRWPARVPPACCSSCGTRSKPHRVRWRSSHHRHPAPPDSTAAPRPTPTSRCLAYHRRATGRRCPAGPGTRTR